MKQQFLYKKITLLAFIISTLLIGQAQQQFTITSSRANNYCNGTCTLFDNPDLNNNPAAVIFITPVAVNGINLNPHPICAYYNGKQWSVMNADNSTMPPGAQFSVQYYAKPDNGHFVHVVTKENLVKNISYINNPALNGNPKAQIQFIQNASPNIRGGSINKNEIKFQYDEVAGKWYITNSNSNTLDNAAGYNISISEVAITTTPPSNPSAPFDPAAKTDNSGQRMFMTVVGKVQGQFSGDNNTNRIELTNFEMEVISPRDLATGQATGKRQRLPVMVQKGIGPASIQFYKALTTNEQLTAVTLEVYKPSGSGTNILDYKIVLTNAAVSNFKQVLSDDQKGIIDSIKITCQTISLTYGTLSTSDTL
jgi:type VI secretion system secreted protein Hcp